VFRITTQAYYKWFRRKEKEAFREDVVCNLVRQVRRKMPRLGGKKLYGMLHEDIHHVGKIGRDKFFDIIGRNGLLVERKKKFVYTTQSYHHYRVYKNLLQEKQITGPDQAWVCDITYLKLKSGFVYLFLLTDKYSRKIVGWNLNKTLAVTGAIDGLKMALRNRKLKNELIHHSDRGIQYCCSEYVKALNREGIKISMAEAGNVYENAMAERVNGILKDEFLLDSTFEDYEQARKAVKQSIDVYNQMRPHWNLKLKTPNQIHYEHKFSSN
jgi:putative transposase